MQLAALTRAASSCAELDPAHFSPRVLAKSPVPMMLLFLAPKKTQVESGRKRRLCAAAAPPGVEVEGAVFGTFLGSLVYALSVRGVTTSFCIRSIRAALLPIANAAQNVEGVDGRVLCAGLAASRAVREQMVSVGAAQTPPSLHSSVGHPTIVLGACATIYVLFALLTSDHFGTIDTQTLEVNARAVADNDVVAQTFDYAVLLLERAVPMNATWLGCGDVEVRAVDAEIRACQRAARAARAAVGYAAQRSLEGTQTVRLMLSWVARAAWPAGMLVNERMHDELMAQLTPEFFNRPVVVQTREVAVDAIVPLSQLVDCSVGGRMRGGESDASSSYTGSRDSRETAFGSVASSLGDDETRVL